MDTNNSLLARDVCAFPQFSHPRYMTQQPHNPSPDRPQLCAAVQSTNNQHIINNFV